MTGWATSVLRSGRASLSTDISAEVWVTNIKRKQSFKDPEEEYSRMNTQCKSPKVEIDFRFSWDKRPVLLEWRDEWKVIWNDFEEVGRSHVTSCFKEFGLYFKYNGKPREGFLQKGDKIIPATLSRMDGRVVPGGSAGKLVWSLR